MRRLRWKAKKRAKTRRQRFDAFSNALSKTPAPRFSTTAFHEHSVGKGNDTSAYAYIQITCDDGKQYWGVGKSTSVGRAGIDAVVSALNQI